MFHKKHFIYIYLFFIGCCGIFVYSITADFSNSIWDKLVGISEKKERISFFKDVRVFYSDKDKPILFLDTIDFSMNLDSGKSFFIHPQGDIYMNDGEKIRYRASIGSYNQNTTNLLLDEEVSLIGKRSFVSADSLRYTVKNSDLRAIGKVLTKTFLPKTKDTVQIEAEKLVTNFEKENARYGGGVKGKLTRERAYEEGIDFSSNILKIDGKQSKIEMVGDVGITKGPLKATSRFGELYLENYNKTLKYFVLSSDVKLSETVKLSPTKIIKRRAYAETLEGRMRDATVILSGYPKVYQNRDVIRGNRIILREDNSVIEVEDASSNFGVQTNKGN